MGSRTVHRAPTAGDQARSRLRSITCTSAITIHQADNLGIICAQVPWMTRLLRLKQALQQLGSILRQLRLGVNKRGSQRPREQTAGRGQRWKPAALFAIGGRMRAIQPGAILSGRRLCADR